MSRKRNGVVAGDSSTWCRPGLALRNQHWRGIALILDNDSNLEGLAYVCERRMKYRTFIAAAVPNAIGIVMNYAVNLVVVNDKAAGLDAGIVMRDELRRAMGTTRPSTLMLTPEIRTQQWLEAAGADYQVVFDRNAKGRRLRTQVAELLITAEIMLRGGRGAKGVAAGVGSITSAS